MLDAVGADDVGELTAQAGPIERRTDGTAIAPLSAGAVARIGARASSTTASTGLATATALELAVPMLDGSTLRLVVGSVRAAAGCGTGAA